MHVLFDHSEHESPVIISFYFKTSEPFHYTAGQFIELTLPHEQPDDRGIKRWFTLSSAPTQDLLRITTRIDAEHGSSFKKELLKMQPGQAVYMSDPMGDFVLPMLIQTPLIFVAAGIGITPFVSMLQWLIDTGEKRPIKFMIGLTSESDIVFQDIFDKLGLHVTIVVSKPSSAWGGEHGHLSAELIVGLEKPSDNTLIYISGPEQMVEDLSDKLHDTGIARKQLVGDFFPGYPSV